MEALVIFRLLLEDRRPHRLQRLGLYPPVVGMVLLLLVRQQRQAALVVLEVAEVLVVRAALHQHLHLDKVMQVEAELRQEIMALVAGEGLVLPEEMEVLQWLEAAELEHKGHLLHRLTVALALEVHHLLVIIQEAAVAALLMGVRRGQVGTAVELQVRQMTRLHLMRLH
jgi:hypothetical protein